MEQTTFARFKELYPAHPLPYDSKREKFYIQKIAQWKEFIPCEVEGLEEYQNWSSSRQPKTLSDLPTSALNKIIPAALELIARGHIRAELTGSFARGDYLTEADPQDYWDIKSRTGRKTKISDVDVIVYFPDRPTLSDALNPDTHLYNKFTIPLIKDGHISHSSSFIHSCVGSRFPAEQPVQIQDGINL